MVNTYEFLLDTYIFLANTKLDDNETTIHHTVKEERAFYDKLKNDLNYRKFFLNLQNDLIEKHDYNFQIDQLFHIICFAMLSTYKGKDIPEDVVKTLK